MENKMHIAYSRILEKCTAGGVEVVCKVDDKNYEVILPCGHKSVRTESSLIKFDKTSYRCSCCFDDKYKKGAQSLGITYLGFVTKENGNKTNTAMYISSCGHEKKIRPTHVPNASFVCTECRLSREEYHKKYRQENKNRLSEINKQWNIKNKEKVRKQRREKYIAEQQKHTRQRQEHYRNHKSAYLFYSKQRKYLLSKAQPSWLSKDQKKEILSFYKDAKRLFVEHGHVFHVDHIVPLNSKKVCGLHVPWNLRVLTQRENTAKFNNFDPDSYVYSFKG